MSKNSSKGNVNAQRQRRRQRKSQTKYKDFNISVPNYVRLTPFDGPEWKELIESLPESLREAYKNARGIEKQHWSDSASPVEDWFNESSVTAQQIRDLIFSEVKKTGDDRLISIERRFFKKFGDFKKLGFQKWHQEVFNMYREPQWNPHEETLERAIKDLLSEFPKKLWPLDNLDAALAASPKTGNSGMPYNTSKWNDDDEARTYYLNEAADLLDGLKPEHPALLFTRRQPKGLGEADVKMRAVECPPKSDTLAGQIFLVPLYKRMKEIKAFMGFRGAANIGNNMRAALSCYEHAFEGDFSQFDAKVWTWWMEIIFSRVLPNIFEGNFTQYFSTLQEWYSTMDLMTPAGIVKGTHGLFSGCIWTNVIGTFVNYIATRYAMYRLGFEEDYDYIHFSYGDDIAIFSDYPIDENLFEQYMSEVSMDCNKSKQAQSSGKERMISFLGFFHVHNPEWEVPSANQYIGIFPTLRSAPSLCFRERFMTFDQEIAMSLGGLDRSQFDSIRYCGKMENWRNHPLRSKVFDLLTNKGLRLTPLPEACVDKNLQLKEISRSSYDNNIKSFWIFQEGKIPTYNPNDLISAIGGDL